MRLGTWNLAGRWDGRHLHLIEAMDCDVLLLTEVSERVELPGCVLHLGHVEMRTKRRWAALASRLPLRDLPDPHGASVMAEVEGLSVCSWNHALTGQEYAGSHAGRAEILSALDRLGLQVPTRDQPHQIESLLSIDHIAVPRSWQVVGTQRQAATKGRVRLSDHDACVVEATAPEATQGAVEGPR